MPDATTTEKLAGRTRDEWGRLACDVHHPSNDWRGWQESYREKWRATATAIVREVLAHGAGEAERIKAAFLAAYIRENPRYHGDPLDRAGVVAPDRRWFVTYPADMVQAFATRPEAEVALLAAVGLGGEAAAEPDVDALTAERDEARAEVERLKRERDACETRIAGLQSDVDRWLAHYQMTNDARVIQSRDYERLQVQHDLLLADRDAYASAALAGLSGLVGTPERGYVIDGGPGLFDADMRRMREHVKKLETHAFAMDRHANRHQAATGEVLAENAALKAEVERLKAEKTADYPVQLSLCWLQTQFGVSPGTPTAEIAEKIDAKREHLVSQLKWERTDIRRLQADFRTLRDRLIGDRGPDAGEHRFWFVVPTNGWSFRYVERATREAAEAALREMAAGTTKGDQT